MAAAPGSEAAVSAAAPSVAASISRFISAPYGGYRPPMGRAASAADHSLTAHAIILALAAAGPALAQENPRTLTKPDDQPGAAGKPIKAGIDGGYDKAFWTIIDSHVTTLITAVVLFLFGTGPIKGFAVTLSLGVILNLFTALFGTRVVYDWVLLKRWLKKLSWNGCTALTLKRSQLSPQVWIPVISTQFLPTKPNPIWECPRMKG